MTVAVKRLAPTRLAYLRHVGPYAGPGIGRTWQRFTAWCAQHGLMQPPCTLYGISQDNPESTPPDKCRYDCCIEVAADFQAQGDVAVQDFAGGSYACAPFRGTAQDIQTAWMRMYAESLPASGHQPDGRPALELYGPGFEMDEKTGVFSCELCVPVRAG